MTGTLVALALAAAVAAWVVAPLLRKDAAQAEATSRFLGELTDLQSEREMALSALRDLEDDRATGKVSDLDYEELKARYTRRGIEVLKQLDEAEAASRGPRAVPREDAL